MAFLKQWMSPLMILFTVIMAMKSTVVVAATEQEGLEPLLIRAVRQAAFGGQSQRPRLPGTNNGPCDCQYLVTCAAQLDKITSSCQLPGGVDGVCCPPVDDGNIGVRAGVAGTRSSVFRQQSVPSATRRNVDRNMVDSACEKGIKDVEQFSEIEKRILRKGIVLKRGTPASNHLRVFKTGPQVPKIHKDALTVAMASSHMHSDFQLPNDCANSYQLQQVEVQNSILSNMCPKMPRCSNPNSKYRTPDGSCNNINNPDWGMSQTALRRLLPPKYEDCISKARVTSVTGRPLPLPRNLGNTILIDVDQPDLRFTLSVMQWAQFMDHDLSHSPFPEMEEGEGGIQCCTEDNKLFPPQTELHERCMPIEIPIDDGFFSQRRHTCMNFVRTDLAMDYACRFGFAEQVNILTQWVDGSTVYGQNQNDTNKVRSFSRGLLRTSGNNFLPENPEAAECVAPNRGGICYLAGESRVNEQPGLTMIHTIWMRQHNRIARQLQQLNPRWPDEAVFQETRRIIAAQIAHISYNEWLPILLGERFMTSFRLSPLRSGFSGDYNPRLNANINNEFSTAAFRFGHSMVQGLMNLYSAQGSVSSTRLRDNFMSAHLMTQPGFFDGFIRGLTRQASQKFDNFVTQDLTNHCYQTPRFDFGMDLMSLNIQRGRDHAIGTYNEARDLCGLRKATSFNDLLDTIPRTTIQRLQHLYAHVDDIDLFVGGMSENAVFGGILGPTFLCIVGDQFARLKKGDRYFYELQGQAGSFSLEQLQEIRRTSWARILCDNSENLDVMQPLAFRFSNNFNPLVPCSSPIIPQMNLQFWRDNRQQGLSF